MFKSLIHLVGDKSANDIKAGSFSSLILNCVFCNVTIGKESSSPLVREEIHDDLNIKEYCELLFLYI